MTVHPIRYCMTPDCANIPRVGPMGSAYQRCAPCHEAWAASDPVPTLRTAARLPTRAPDPDQLAECARRRRHLEEAWAAGMELVR